MKVSAKVVAGTIAMALAAMMRGQPALAKSTEPNTLAKAPPTYLIGARGLSVNGFFSDDDGDGCSYCESLGNCGCFLADASSGGNGFFQFSNSAATPMTWEIELDYNDGVDNEIPTTIDGEVCSPVSGFGQGIQQAGKKFNTFYFETTGLFCDTANDNTSYTGSYVLEGGTNAYSNASGSGNLSIGVYGDEGPEYVNQIQFTGNIGQ
jgi:hypothetical protein